MQGRPPIGLLGPRPLAVGGLGGVAATMAASGLDDTEDGAFDRLGHEYIPPVRRMGWIRKSGPQRKAFGRSIHSHSFTAVAVCGTLTEVQKSVRPSSEPPCAAGRTPELVARVPRGSETRRLQDTDWRCPAAHRPRVRPTFGGYAACVTGRPTAKTTTPRATRAHIKLRTSMRGRRRTSVPRERRCGVAQRCGVVKRCGGARRLEVGYRRRLHCWRGACDRGRRKRFGRGHGGVLNNPSRGGGKARRVAAAERMAEVNHPQLNQPPSAHHPLGGTRFC